MDAIATVTTASQAPVTPPQRPKLVRQNAILLAAPMKKSSKRKQPDTTTQPVSVFKWPKPAPKVGVPEPYFKHNDLPVYKIAYGRFVYVELVNDALAFRFSEWDHQVGVGWTMHKIRDISLNTEQFLLLCSMIMNGCADPVDITVSYFITSS